jgi:hypothetical protein
MYRYYISGNIYMYKYCNDVASTCTDTVLVFTFTCTGAARWFVCMYFTDGNICRYICTGIEVVLTMLEQLEQCSTGIELMVSPLCTGTALVVKSIVLKFDI